MSFRITVDTGGTFTDVVVSDEQGRLTIGKSPTTERAFAGVRGGLEVAAASLGLGVEELLSSTSLFIYSTTRSTNAILERHVARTALLTTKGFADVLTLREGGKANGFDLAAPFPEPYVPRRLTFEIDERISSEGEVVERLDEEGAREVIGALGERGVEAVGVCLLWSVANGAHERRVGELLDELLPGVPYTLSHELNPIVREFRRASAAAIDASLKPLMGTHLREVGEDLRNSGLTGELMVATSYGGVMHIEDVAARPIETVRSGPSMAPVAAKTYAAAERRPERDVIVCDMGGTSFDVSLIRDGEVTYTRETWLGPRFTGLLTGVSSVDIRSVGAGGGSIAWVDDGGLLRVGPHSAGARPGPACYGRGGDAPTVTDAAVALGYIDPAGFLGGRMWLDVEASRRVTGRLAERLGIGLEAAADAILSVANEHMVVAVQDITVNEGVDPREALIVAGGGAAGLTIVPFLRELGCAGAILPRTAGALSATGAQFSDIVAEFSRSEFIETASFDAGKVNGVLAELDASIEEFAGVLRERAVGDISVDYFVDARYAYQNWELEVPCPSSRFAGDEDLERLSNAFDQAHERVFAVAEPGAPIECLTWRARVRSPVGRAVVDALGSEARLDDPSDPAQTRKASFDGVWQATAIHHGSGLSPGTVVQGPAIIEEPTSTLVVPPGATVHVTDLGNYYLELDA